MTGLLAKSTGSTLGDVTATNLSSECAVADNRGCPSRRLLEPVDIDGLIVFRLRKTF